MKRLKIDLSEYGYTPTISMFRNFTNAVAGTGAVFAALHVFIGYMGFDKTPNENTGEIPRFLDVAEYRYYIILFLLFALIPIASGIFRRIPAVTLLPAAVTVTYVLLLFDADLLTKGPMTFLLFSLFSFAGHTYVSLCSQKKRAIDLYRCVTALIGLISSVWALKIYFSAPSSSERLLETLKPDEALDGLSAVWRYERLGVLAETFDAGNRNYYLIIALCGILLSALLVLLPKWKPLIAISAIALTGYLAYLVGWLKLSYYPMLFSVPQILLSVGCIVYSAVSPVKREETAEAAEGSTEEGGET